MLFATNNQINLLVPGAVSSQIGLSADMFVNFGGKSSSKTSAAYTVSIIATDPGIFTLGSDGVGDGAILDAKWATITQANPVGMSSTTASDIIAVFMTGLGAPLAGAPGCESTADYLTSLGAATSTSPTSIDGAIIQSALLGASLSPPCFSSGSVSATVGGVPAAHVTYAGWVPDSIAGLYQVNLQPPSATGTFTTASGGTITNITSLVKLPIQITIGGAHSQANVTVWVGPKP